MTTGTLSLPVSRENVLSLSAATGFKDWALVCEAMGIGRQSVILRKGGLAEGRGGFQFGQHREFFLFPTRYHEQARMLRPEELPSLGTAVPSAIRNDGGGPAATSVEIRFFCRLEAAWRVENWETVARLAPFHVYREEVARERFAYSDRQHDAGALGVALCRVYQLAPAWVLADEPSFGGCKSWIDLPAPPAETTLLPVLDDEAHRALRAQLAAILGASSCR